MTLRLVPRLFNQTLSLITHSWIYFMPTWAWVLLRLCIDFKIHSGLKKADRVTCGAFVVAAYLPWALAHGCYLFSILLLAKGGKT